MPSDEERVRGDLYQHKAIDRPPDLIRAELVDALRDYASIFMEKSDMELERYHAVNEIADRVERGGSADSGNVNEGQEWARRYQILEMRFRELQIRVNRLIIEHGEN